MLLSPLEDWSLLFLLTVPTLIWLYTARREIGRAVRHEPTPPDREDTRPTRRRR